MSKGMLKPQKTSTPPRFRVGFIKGIASLVSDTKQCCKVPVKLANFGITQRRIRRAKAQRMPV